MPCKLGIEIEYGADVYFRDGALHLDLAGANVQHQLGLIIQTNGEIKYAVHSPEYKNNGLATPEAMERALEAFRGVE